MFYIYKIECLKNKRVYIGQTKCLEDRKWRHFWELRHNRNENPDLQSDYNIFGNDNFTFVLIEECDTREKALERETYWINYYGGIEEYRTYNFKDRFNNNIIMRNKLRATAKITPNYGGRGKAKSEECKKKISDANAGKRRGIPPWNKGLKDCYTDEARYKMGSSNRGKKLSQETRDKISKSNKGKKVSEETCKKISEAKQGKCGKRKYSMEFVEQLRLDYKQCRNFNELARKYNINPNSVNNLIRYGQAYPRIENMCNDYLRTEYKLSNLEVGDDQDKIG